MMIRKFVALFAITAATLAPSLAHASDDGELASVGITDAGIAYIKHKHRDWDSSLGSTGCSNTSFLAVDASTDAGRRTLAGAAAALLKGYQVRVYTSGCHAGWPSVTRVDIIGG